MGKNRMQGSERSSVNGSMNIHEESTCWIDVWQPKKKDSRKGMSRVVVGPCFRHHFQLCNFSASEVAIKDDVPIAKMQPQKKTNIKSS
jgi:hypothetical protein